ncbi:MAG TPA: phage holin family protein [Gammaproteobacteria bacterium]|nr:phage holin family protein [Gammaproteobacteria bacterium]
MDVSTLFFVWLATAIGLGFACLIVPGIKAENLTAFAIAACVLGLINAFIRPVLWFLTMPLTVVSFGLFALVINALMIMLTASIVPGFEVKGFGSAFLGALLMALLGIIGLIALPLLTGADINWYYYEQHMQMHP